MCWAVLKMDMVANQLAHFLDPVFHCPKHAGGLHLCIAVYLYKRAPFKLANKAVTYSVDRSVKFSWRMISLLQ